MATSFKVTNQRQTTVFVNGALTQVMTITFETLPGGRTGSVQIPLTRIATLDYVNQTIADRVAAIAAIDTL